LLFFGAPFEGAEAAPGLALAPAGRQAIDSQHQRMGGAGRHEDWTLLADRRLAMTPYRVIDCVSRGAVRCFIKGRTYTQSRKTTNKQAAISVGVGVRLPLTRGTTLFDLGGLQMDLEALLGLRVDLITPIGLPPKLRAKSLAEARPV
jgi:hypothetical protein